MTPEPLCIDLFCGYGGWTRGFIDAGFRVIGFDIEPRCKKYYPGTFIQADVQTITVRGSLWIYTDMLDGRRTGTDMDGLAFIVASPPCQRFSLAQNAWGTRDTEAGMPLVRSAFRICREAKVPFAIENVVGSIRKISAEFGNPRARHNPWFLWGDFPGFIAPLMKKGIGDKKWKKLPGDGQRGQRRSIIPYPLARALADACLP